jgi:single-strand DNA-binding protein
MNLNQVTLCGRLGRDPEMRYTAGGAAVCNFSMAISSWIKKKDEEGYDENVVWIDVTCWGKIAERAAAQAKKGTEVLVVGRLDTRSWEDKDDPSKKHFRTFVTALNVQFGHGRISADSQDEKTDTPSTPPANTTADSQAASAADDGGDLPF